MYTHKILWSEGMILHPQHFQQWETHSQQQYWQYQLARWQDAWGLHVFEYDTHDLSQGRLSIQRLQAMLPSGLWLDYDAQLLAVLKIELNQTSTQRVYLQVPLNQQVKQITGHPDPGLNARWQAKYLKIMDYYDGSREQEILTGVLNLRLTTDYQTNDNFEYLLLGQIDYDARLGYQFNLEILPVCLNLKASPGFKHLLSNTRLAWESILAHSQAAPEENMLLKQAVARLRYFSKQKIISPLALFQLFYELSVGLGCEIDIDYAHRESGCCIYTLAEHLKIFLPTRFKPVITLGLEQIHENCFATQFFEPKLLKSYQWVIGIKPERGSIASAEKIQHGLKCASPSLMEDLVRQALPGLPLKHLHVPPDGVPIKAGYYYFYLIPEGYVWQTILADRQILIFVQAEMAAAEIALYQVE